MTFSQHHLAHNPEVAQVTWLIEKDAAAHLSIDPRTIRRWVAAGKLKAYRAPSGRLRFKRSDLDAAMSPVPMSGGAV